MCLCVEKMGEAQMRSHLECRKKKGKLIMRKTGLTTLIRFEVKIESLFKIPPSTLTPEEEEEEKKIPEKIQRKEKTERE